MLDAGFHCDRNTRAEYLVVVIHLTRPLDAFHLACYIGTRLVQYMSGLPLPRGLYMTFHDVTEPWLRRWCEARPNPRLQPYWQHAYNRSPVLLRTLFIAVWGR